MNKEELDADTLTDRQFWLAGLVAVKGYPRILETAGEKRVAKNLERLGWGTVEAGGEGEQIFRLNQAGQDAFAWVSRSRISSGLVVPQHRETKHGKGT